jgi:hypothetical protein
MRVDYCYLSNPVNEMGTNLGMTIHFERGELEIENLEKLLDDKWPQLKEAIVFCKKQADLRLMRGNLK